MFSYPVSDIVSNFITSGPQRGSYDEGKKTPFTFGPSQLKIHATNKKEACFWICFAFCCFFPTLSTASCFAMYKLQNFKLKSDIIDLSSNNRVLCEMVTASKGIICSIPVANLSPEMKRSALVMAVCSAIETEMTPPQEHSHSNDYSNDY